MLYEMSWSISWKIKRFRKSPTESPTTNMIGQSNDTRDKCDFNNV